MTRYDTVIPTALLEEIRRSRRLMGDPVRVELNDNVGYGGHRLHRLIYESGRWEYVHDETVFRCTWDAPDGCDELVNPYGDGLCRTHREAAAALDPPEGKPGWRPVTEWDSPENPPCLSDPDEPGTEEFFPDPDAEPPF